MAAPLCNCDSTPAHRTFFDPSVPGQLTAAIVSALTTVTDRPPTAVPSLYDTADTDALERLLEHAATATADPATFGFECLVDDLSVVVSGDGQVAVYDGDDGDTGTDTETGVGLEFDR